MTATAPRPTKSPAKSRTKNRETERGTTRNRHRRSWLPRVLTVGSLALVVGLLRRRKPEEPAAQNGLVTFVPPRKPLHRFAGRDGWANPAARAAIGERTLRTDRWWLQPLVTFVALALLIAYLTWRAFANRWYFSEPYISPLYSPCLSTSCQGSTMVKLWPGPTWVSPALYVLIFPLGFRLTCYYYRKAYYRAFWLSPPACAVAEPHKRYTGETRFPLIFQNVHRYFFYFGVIFNAILTYDAVISFRDQHGAWGHMGLGSLVLVVNAVLLWLYTLSCHSCRHIMGGRLNHFSRHPIRYRFWTSISALNGHHMLFAWISLFFVSFTDFYVLLVASGAIADPRFF